MPLEWNNPDREDSLITTAQRRAILDDDHRESLSTSYKSLLRTRIRRRIQHGILDFRILVEELPDDQLRDVFFKIGELDEEAPGEYGGVPVEFAYLMAFIYRFGLVYEDNPERLMKESMENSFMRQEGPHWMANTLLATLGREALRRALEAHGEHGEPEIEVSLPDVFTEAELSDAALSELPTDALTKLLQRGEITPEEYSDEIQRRKEENETASGGENDSTGPSDGEV